MVVYMQMILLFYMHSMYNYTLINIIKNGPFGDTARGAPLRGV
jgi:hypothetical protein